LREHGSDTARVRRRSQSDAKCALGEHFGYPRQQLQMRGALSHRPHSRNAAAGSASASSLRILYTMPAQLDALFIRVRIHCLNGKDRRRCIMDALHTAIAVRALIVLVMIAVLVVAALVLARREKRRASNVHGDRPTRGASWQAAIARGPRCCPTNCERTGANDADVSARPIQRRAA
jgi:hypothetical protein